MMNKAKTFEQEGNDSLETKIYCLGGVTIDRKLIGTQTLQPGILYQLKQGASLGEACYLGEAAAALTLQSCHTVNEAITLDLLHTLM